jgi:hypothetical protein
MDFLDPKKQRAHIIRMIAGYILIGIAIMFGTIILLYQAYGFGIDKGGEVVQSGLVFMSSGPDRSQIYLNGEKYKAVTNTKVSLEAGDYNVEIRRNGYDSWKRQIRVEGGSVQHFDYPKLFPSKLTTNTVKTYPKAPSLATSSPDRHWLLVHQPDTSATFDIYDISDPKKAQLPTVITLPESVISNPRAGTHNWKLAEWSSDNRHVLLQHIYTGVLAGAPIDTAEYIMVDRTAPDQSQNLTRSFTLQPGKVLALQDKKFDRYFIFDPTGHTLGRTTLADAGRLTPLLDNVLNYKSYGDDVFLYMTDIDPDSDTDAKVPGKVWSMVREGTKTYKIREHGSVGPYLVDIAKYSGAWYVVAGSGGDGKTYVYKNPQRIRNTTPKAILVPVQIMRVPGATQVSFSSNSGVVIVQNTTRIATYDAESEKGYNFVSRFTPDPEVERASWMGSHRLMYVSGGKLVTYDYDNINSRTLSAAHARYLPHFDRDYEYFYAFTPPTPPSGESMSLTVTPMLTVEDQ